jgi:hypothetical protein
VKSERKTPPHLQTPTTTSSPMATSSQQASSFGGRWGSLVLDTNVTGWIQNCFCLSFSFSIGIIILIFYYSFEAGIQQLPYYE